MKGALLTLCLLFLTNTTQAQSTSRNQVALATPFSWPTFDEAIVAAPKSRKPILIDIFAPWCGWCARMQKDVYANKDLQEYLNTHFEYARLNLDDSTTHHQFRGYQLTSQELGYGLGAQGTPTTVFLSSNGDYITRLPGFTDLATFRQVLRYIASRSYEKMTFEAFINRKD